MRLYVSQLPFETALSGSFLGAGGAALAQIDDDVDTLRVLLIDHQSTQCRSLSEGLERNGFSVDIATGDNATANAALAGDYALILLSSMRPGLAGFSAVESIRRKSDAPLLVITERDSVAARMAGLELGASDYLVKPFSLSDLLVRVKALARHPRMRHQPVLRLADLELDERTARCSRGGVELDLTRMEFSLLLVLLRGRGRVLSRQLLAQRVWNSVLEGKSNAVDVAVLRLRTKLDAPFDIKLLHTVRGEGYVLEVRHFA
ncbi:winged helix-turn-helix domain-containing protein [Variovorax boronicumulans]|uniref:winged helix-turn-helix domain-containing protein n=1 Tax=Variovorax boronicumulans TaxID=436515 RepID=UPI00339983B2